MAYEVQLRPTSDWQPISKLLANKRIARHHLRQRMAALYQQIDRGLVLNCSGHGLIRRTPGRWQAKQQRLFDSIKVADLVTILTINGVGLTYPAKKKVGDVWHLSDGAKVESWEVTNVRGRLGGKKQTPKRRRK